ncbi:MAG: hypothetical protein JW750_05745 [Anaerolineaceae bacterium]|nr:hypothetical protein [Anaerolineaceae bacterium]
MWKKLLRAGVEITKLSVEAAAEMLRQAEDFIADNEAPPHGESPMPPRSAPPTPPMSEPSPASARSMLATLFPLPSMAYEAVGSGKHIQLDRIDRAAVLFVHNHNAAHAAAEINASLLQTFLPHDPPCFTAHIVDLSSLPRLARPIAEHELLKAYQKIKTQYLHDPLKTAALVHILPDWQGRLPRALGLDTGTPRIHVLVAAPNADVVSQIESPDPLPTILELLEMLQSETTARPSS